MERGDFEALRDVPDKFIDVDIRFARRDQMRPALVAESMVIENGLGIQLRLQITFNPETGAKNFNVFVPGVGPICRLDVDGPPHPGAGRSHKHSLRTNRCPDRNLPDGVVDRPDLAGRSVRELFGVFCQMACISHRGIFVAPDE